MKKITAKDLRPDPNNPRRMPEGRLPKLQRSLEEFGDLSGIVRNIVTNELVTAHRRQEILPPDAVITITQRFKPPTDRGTVALGYVDWDGERYAYREVAWERAKQVAANLAANNPELQGEFEFSMQADAVAYLEGEGYDATLTGYDTERVEEIMAWTPDDDHKPERERKPREYCCPECGHRWRKT